MVIERIMFGNGDSGSPKKHLMRSSSGASGVAALIKVLDASMTWGGMKVPTVLTVMHGYRRHLGYSMTDPLHTAVNSPLEW